MGNRADPNFITALIAGGIAGTAVDIALFPLDTIKTRLQSENGFWKAGGFRGIYSGLASVALGSAPGAAVFFSTYEMTKKFLLPFAADSLEPFVHMTASSCGEVAACVVRVPVEVVKQRAQANPQYTSFQVLKRLIASEGIQGLYRGYLSTVLREIPFSLIQFPLWELLKKLWSNHQGKYVDSWQGALCGAFAGGVSAGLTTPLDVAKTRIMLSEATQASVPEVLQEVWKTSGFKGLYAGLIPRITWMLLGGAIFFGAYEKSKHLITSYLFHNSSV